MSDLDKRILALRKTVWGLPEVRAFLGCGNSKAYNRIATCRLRYGGAIGKDKQVLRDRFLEMEGTDYEAEMRNAYIEKEAERNAKREIEIFPSRLQDKA